LPSPQICGNTPYPFGEGRRVRGVASPSPPSPSLTPKGRAGQLGGRVRGVGERIQAPTPPHPSPLPCPKGGVRGKLPLPPSPTPKGRGKATWRVRGKLPPLWIIGKG